ncbi:IS66 family insertion sequence element accessory protein TnpB [uncultured Deefgea sp.]
MEGAAYTFRNQCSNRLKVLLWDRFGVWLAQRRLRHGR